jgi:hypothetical protein
MQAGLLQVLLTTLAPPGHDLLAKLAQPRDDVGMLLCKVAGLAGIVCDVRKKELAVLGRQRLAVDFCGQAAH